MTLRRNPYLTAAAVILCLYLPVSAPALAQYNAFKDPSGAGSASGSAAGPDFKAVTEDIKGGKIAVGATAYVVVLFKNEGASSIKVGNVNLYPSSNVSANITLNQCADAPLATDAQCAMTVAVMGKQGGAWRVEMLVDHDGRSRVSTASISGDVELNTAKQDNGKKLDVEAAPASLDFGTSAGGLSMVRSIVLSNRSAEDIQIWDISMDVPDKSGFSYKSQCPEYLQPEESCNVVVTWTPAVKGLAQGVLVVDHSGKSGMTQVEVKGVLNAPEPVAAKVEGNASVSLSGLDFGTSAGGIALVKSVVLSNNSPQVIKIKDISFNVPEQSGFSYKSQCPESLQPEESCNIIVTWSPTSKGLAQGVLIVHHSGKNGLAQAEVKGILQPGAVTSAAVYPESVPDRGLLVSDKEEINFGTGIKEEASITLSLVNAGNYDLVLKSIVLAGANNGLAVADSGCAKEMTLKAGDACALTVNWIPRRVGAILDSLQISHTGARGILVIPVRGAADSVVSNDAYSENKVIDTILHGDSGDVKKNNTDSGKQGLVNNDQPVSLKGFTVTSHSANRAIINGSSGGIMVRDGEDAVIAGVKWTVTIVPSGVVLSNNKHEVSLTFDRSLKPLPKQEDDAATTTTAAEMTHVDTSGAPIRTAPPAINELKMINP